MATTKESGRDEGESEKEREKGGGIEAGGVFWLKFNFIPSDSNTPTLA